MSNQHLAHMVYFTLNDDSQEQIDALVTACKKYLDGHEGLVYFGVGKVTPDLARPVNVRDFHVSLNTVFVDRAAHDAYQVAPRHIQFINECKSNWKQVRVFDSDVS